MGEMTNSPSPSQPTPENLPSHRHAALRGAYLAYLEDTTQ